MKNTKRILSLLLVVSMLASCMVITTFAADTETASGTKFSDVAADSLYATAVTTLNQMGVINGYPDGSFGPDQNVTRAEFTAMLMRTLNYGSLGSTSAAELPFTDIDDADTGISWAIPNINIAYDMGIINGYAEDNTFRPRNNVAYEEALKMIVCALGYTGIDTSGTPWYSLYLAQANKLGITEFASQFGSPETPASRACIAQMLYDSLEVNLCKDGNVTGDTILSSYLGYTKNIGLISSDGATSLTAPDVVLNNDEIQIYAQDPYSYLYETKTYKAKDINLRNYLGYEIEYYYKTDGVTRDLSFYVLNPSNELTLDASMIEPSGSTATQIRYYKSETASSATALTLDSENVVIYNGKLYGANAATSRFDTSMIPKVGTVTLLDSDKDNAYDLVKIQAYEIYYVATKASSDYSIVDDVTRSSNNGKLILDVDNGAIETKIVDTNGNTMNFSSISNGNIICLAKTNPANGGEVVQTAVVVKNSVTGKVTSSKAGQSITVNGNIYEYSEAAPWMPGGTGLLTEPVMHDSATFYMDINGKVVAYKKDATTDNLSYGYVMGISSAAGNFDDSRYLRVLTQDNKKQDFVINAKTRVNNQDMGSTDGVVTALTTSAGTHNTDGGTVTVHQVIKYSTKVSNGAMAIDRIYTVTPDANGQTVTTDKLYYYTPISAATKSSYTSTGTRFTGGSGKTISTNTKTIVFVVPSDRSQYDDYSKSTVAQTFRTATASASNPSAGYSVEFFDVSTTNTASVVVSYGANAASVVDDYTGLSVVNQDIENRTNNGESMSYLLGFTSAYNNAKGTLDTWLSPKSNYTPVPGDIFRHASDSDGYATIEPGNVIYKINGGNTWGIDTSGGSNFLTAKYSVLLGSVVAKDDTSISILPDYLTAVNTENGETAADTSSAQSFQISDFRNARTLYYDYSNNKLTISDVSSDYEGVLRGLTTYSDGQSNPTKVLVYLYQGAVKLIAILGENIAQ